jgi:hypothetical protein
MQELRFVAVSEDGSYAVLAIPGRSGRYILPIDERLRAVALGQTSRLAQYEIEVESPLRPKEIQARIRAGETAEEIADAAGIPVERVRWFEGPVLAERGYIADQAQAGSVRRAGDSSGPGPRLGDIVTARLSAAGTDPADGEWDSRKRGDGNWQVSLTFPSGGRLHVAEWVFDSRRRHVMPDDDNAARLSLPESELPAEPVPMPGEATVTPIASRLGAAAGMGGGTVGGPVSGAVGGPGMPRFRPDRSVIPDRSLGIDRSLADRPMPPAAPAAERTAVSDRPAVPDRFAPPERPSAQSRSVQQERPGAAANPGYAEFPESAPYRAPEPAQEQGPYRDQAHERADDRDRESANRSYGDPGSASSAYRTQVTDSPTYREPAPEPRTYREVAPEAPSYHAPVPQQPLLRDQVRETAEPVPPAQASAGTAVEDSERERATPPRTVVFEEPEPAFGDERSELPSDAAWAEPASAEPVVLAEPRAAEPRAAEPAQATVPAAHRGDATRADASPAVAAPAARPDAQAGPATAPAEPTVTTPPEVREQKPVAARAEPSVAATASAARPTTSAESVEAAESSQVIASPEAVTPKETEAAAERSAGTAPVSAAPSAAPVAAEPSAAAPAPAEPASAPAEEQPARPRSGAKKNAKGRRSSVPSWDEIMLGSSRQRD